MGPFIDQVREALAFVAEAKRGGALVEQGAAGRAGWPPGRTLVLADDTRRELGKPSAGSAYALMWDEGPEVGKDRIWRVGPEMNALPPEAPFGVIVLARANGEGREYELHTALRDAFHEIELSGLMIRVLPGRQTIWCRLHHAAAARGHGFREWGVSIIDGLKQVPGVEGVDVLFVCGDGAAVGGLREVTQAAGRIGGALTKMGAEAVMDCDACEFFDGCDSVAALKRIRAAHLRGGEHG